MKKYVLVCFLLMQGALSNGQSIIDTNKIWSNSYFHYSTLTFSTEFIRFTADTLIGTQSYKRVEAATDSNHASWAFHGYARETGDKKLYYRIAAASPEKLLYDLDVQPGDSLLVYTLYNYPSAIFDSMMYHVTSKDSILVGNSFREQLHLSVNLAGYFMEVEQWIAGMGSLGGMLHNTTGKVGGDSFTLMCYYENSVLLWHQPSGSNCYILTGVGNNGFRSNAISIRPNPLTSVSLIRAEGQFSRLPLEIDFYDPLGRLTGSQRFTGELQISRDDFRQGVFYYIISSGEGQVARGTMMVY